MTTQLDKILDDIVSGGTPLRVQEVDLAEPDLSRFARLRKDPRKFVPSIFDGEWGDASAPPRLGTIRLVAAIEDGQGNMRLLGRQGKHLYAFPRDG